MKTRSLRKASILAILILGHHHEGWSRSYETQSYIVCSSQSNDAGKCLKCVEKKAVIPNPKGRFKPNDLRAAFELRKNHLRTLFDGFWAVNCVQPISFDEALYGHIYNACAYTKLNDEWEYWSCYENFCEDSPDASSQTCLNLEEGKNASKRITDVCASAMKHTLDIKALRLEYARELAACKSNH